MIYLFFLKNKFFLNETIEFVIIYNFFWYNGI